MYDLSVHPKMESRYPGFAIDAGIDRRHETNPPRIYSQEARSHRYQLRALSGGGYTPTTPATVTQSARGGALIREWAALELFWSAPTGTTVRARLHDGLGVDWYWDGGAWAVAISTDWNTPEDLIANFSTFAATDATSLGVTWELSTSKKLVTPVVWGGVMAGRLMFAAISGADAAATRSDGWLDDIIHRVWLPWLKANLKPEVTFEAETGSAVTVLEFGGGLGDGETNYAVADVQAVYDLDADPLMFTPLAGTFDPTDKTFALTVPLVDCTRYAARLVYEPHVVYTGQRAHFDSKLPQVVVESIDEIMDQGSPGFARVRDVANLTAVTVPRPRHKSRKMTMLLQSDDHVNCFELKHSVERALGLGVFLVSANTGMPVSIHGGVKLRPARANANVESVARFDLTITSREYHGVETVTHLMKLGGFVPTLVPDEPVTAR